MAIGILRARDDFQKGEMGYATDDGVSRARAGFVPLGGSFVRAWTPFTTARTAGLKKCRQITGAHCRRTFNIRKGRRGRVWIVFCAREGRHRATHRAALRGHRSRMENDAAA